ncbi:MAG TPA: NAD-binding protein [Beijerinckia sp.]|jgi:Trk K+ transport system NAD-binding subunit|nr:NAD-binding protein [Beijerinckia sp.]
MDAAITANDQADTFLVCGLGRLGQQCVLLLKEFEVNVIGIDRAPSPSWESSALPDILDGFIIGDCCQVEVLQRAGIAHCRALLLVTNNERTNIAAAFAARSLNPNVRLIIRSAQENLNRLLHQQLGNLAALEPSQFSANVFALASLGDRTQALFKVGDAKMAVVRLEVEAAQDWCEGRRLCDLNTLSHRVLSHVSQANAAPGSFYSWNPEDIVQAGDSVTFVESSDRLTSLAGPRPDRAEERSQPAISQRVAWLKDRLKQFWHGGTQVRRVAFGSLLIMLGLVVAGILLFGWENPDISFFDALNISVVLALGGFDNVFGALHLPFPISSGLYLFSVILTISSAVFLGIIYAMLTERVLSTRLQIARRRPHAPQAGHTIVVGMGTMGRGVVAILQDLQRPLVGLAEQPVGTNVASDVPILVGPIRETLERANVATAKSVVVLTDDEVVNLEIGLMTRSYNPHCTLVLRTADQQFAKNVARLIPAAKVMGDDAIAAEAIAGASFGENILSAFHLDGHSVLITEYSITPGDTLIDRLLAEIAYGYCVVPVFHRRGNETRLLPSDDVHLQADDQLVVLATLEGLQRIEAGERVAPGWLLHVEKVPYSEASFEGANTIARISGCNLRVAREAMIDLPATLEIPLYRHQGLRLVRELGKVLVTASLKPVGGGL